LQGFHTSLIAVLDESLLDGNWMACGKSASEFAYNRGYDVITQKPVAALRCEDRALHSAVPAYRDLNHPCSVLTEHAELHVSAADRCAAEQNWTQPLLLLRSEHRI
jgi:hypothetical protein